MSQLVDSKDELPLTALIDRKPENLNGFLERVCAILEQNGAEHILITGLPLPGKSIDDLIYHNQWGRSETARQKVSTIKGKDTLLHKTAGLTAPKRWHLQDPSTQWLQDSALLQVLKAEQSLTDFTDIIGVHVHRFSRVQMAIIAAGDNLQLSEQDIFFFCCQCQIIMHEIDSERPLEQSRTGELSSRERHVLSLTAQGKTANHIATELSISQRTVHAHLQNASDKLQAANKTQTVVEAVRYGQIELG